MSDAGEDKAIDPGPYYAVQDDVELGIARITNIRPLTVRTMLKADFEADKEFIYPVRDNEPPHICIITTRENLKANFWEAYAEYRLRLGEVTE